MKEIKVEWYKTIVPLSDDEVAILVHEGGEYRLIDRYKNRNETVKKAKRISTINKFLEKYDWGFQFTE